MKSNAIRGLVLHNVTQCFIYKCVVYTSDHKMSHTEQPTARCQEDTNCKTREVKLTDVYCNLVICRQSKTHMQTVKSLSQVVKELQQACTISVCNREGSEAPVQHKKVCIK